MSSRNGSGTDPLDVYIGRLLKNWLAQQSPPGGSKALLLRAASLNPTVGRKHLVLVPALMQLMHAFRRAFMVLFLHPVKQPVMYSFLAERSFSSSGYYDLSQRIARNDPLQSLLPGMGIFCLIS